MDDVGIIDLEKHNVNTMTSTNLIIETVDGTEKVVKTDSSNIAMYKRNRLERWPWQV